MARYPEFSGSTNLESKLIEFFVLVKFYCTVRFGSLEPFTVCKIGDFPRFLSALASNNQFIIKLVKMWPGPQSESKSSCHKTTLHGQSKFETQWRVVPMICNILLHSIITVFENSKFSHEKWERIQSLSHIELVLQTE